MALEVLNNEDNEIKDIALHSLKDCSNKWNDLEIPLNPNTKTKIKYQGFWKEVSKACEHFSLNFIKTEKGFQIEDQYKNIHDSKSLSTWIKKHLKEKYLQKWKNLASQGFFPTKTELYNHAKLNCSFRIWNVIIRGRTSTLNVKAYKKLYLNNYDDTCKTCGRKETQLHVLNNCKKLLPIYKYRHDCGVQIISEFAKNNLQMDECIIIDKPCPSHIYSGNIKANRPDILVINESTKQIKIFEYTVCYDPKIEEKRNAKIEKYEPLVASMKKQGYNVNLQILALGSLGSIPKWANCSLKQLIRDEEIQKCLKTVLHSVILGTMIVWSNYKTT